MKSILYIQYTNPAVYPPLEHSSLLLAERGWQVHHLGIAADGGANALALPSHSRISCSLMHSAPRGLGRAARYATFLSWCRREIIKRRPAVVYCSDVKSYPVGLWAAKRRDLLTILHEHDPPSARSGGPVMSIMLGIRERFARSASLCVIPQAERASRFVCDTGVEQDRVKIVNNCPSIAELIRPTKGPSAVDGFTLWYHGSIGPHQLPPSIVTALALLPADVRLAIAGYETVSWAGYVRSLQARARELGMADRLTYLGPLPSRSDLLSAAARADLGLCLFASQFRDPMVGASNKPFDYLACGLPLVTNGTAEWESFFGWRGVSVGCDPDDPADIARAVLALKGDPDRRRAMADRGRELIRTEWNYEAQFAKVAAVLEAATPADWTNANQSKISEHT